MTVLCFGPTVESIMPTLTGETVPTATLARFFQTLADKRLDFLRPKKAPL